MNKTSDEFYTHHPPLIKSILTPATPLHVRTEHSIRVHRIRHPRIPTIPTPPSSCGGSAASSSVIRMRKTTKSTKKYTKKKKEKRTRLFSCKGRKWRNTPLPRSLTSWHPLPATRCPVAAALDVDAYTFLQCITQHTVGKW